MLLSVYRLIAGFSLFSATLAAHDVLDSQRADYLEDERTGRVVAQIDAQLLRGEHGVRLALSVSAVGAFVDPAPGYEGVRGANKNTTREMEMILREKRAGVVTRAEKSGSMAFYGTIREGRSVKISERRTRTDGSVELNAKTSREHVAELLMDSGETGEAGIHTTEILLDGRPRLRVKFLVGAKVNRIVSIESLSLADARRASKAVLDKKASTDATQKAGIIKGEVQ